MLWLLFANCILFRIVVCVGILMGASLESRNASGIGEKLGQESGSGGRSWVVACSFHLVRVNGKQHFTGGLFFVQISTS